MKMDLETKKAIEKIEHKQSVFDEKLDKLVDLLTEFIKSPNCQFHTNRINDIENRLERIEKYYGNDIADKIKSLENTRPLHVRVLKAIHDLINKHKPSVSGLRSSD